MNNNLLFIYGTLLDADNEFANHLKANSSFFCLGHFKGTLYDAGEYPAALYSQDSKFQVHGSIVQLKDPKTAFRVLDEYEGFEENKISSSLFVRKIIEAETGSGPIRCWAYLFNQPVDKLRKIPSGTYKK